MRSSSLKREIVNHMLDKLVGELFLFDVVTQIYVLCVQINFLDIKKASMLSMYHIKCLIITSLFNGSFAVQTDYTHVFRYLGSSGIMTSISSSKTQTPVVC